MSILLRANKLSLNCSQLFRFPVWCKIMSSTSNRLYWFIGVVGSKLKVFFFTLEGNLNYWKRGKKCSALPLMGFPRDRSGRWRTLHNKRFIFPDRLRNSDPETRVDWFFYNCLGLWSLSNRSVVVIERDKVNGSGYVIEDYFQLLFLEQIWRSENFVCL